MLSLRPSPLVVLTTLAGCGKKGPPLAPLRLVPAARRSSPPVAAATTWSCASRCRRPTPTDQARSISPRSRSTRSRSVRGPSPPPNRDLLTTPRVVGTIAVRPPPVEGEGSDTPSAPGAPPDTRPAPGDRVTFVDQLTAEKLKPIARRIRPRSQRGPANSSPCLPWQAGPAAPAVEADPGKPASGQAGTGSGSGKPEPGAVAAEAPQPPAPSGVALFPARIYAIRGLSKSGRPGPAIDARHRSARAAGDAADRGRRADADRGRGRRGLDRRRWASRACPHSRSISTAATRQPTAAQPVADRRTQVRGWRRRVRQGTMLCRARGAEVRTVTIESAPSAPACLTPLDKFPPAAPKGLAGGGRGRRHQPGLGQNSEADLGGYMVLRGEAPGDTLQPLTAQPIEGRQLSRHDGEARSTIHLRRGRRGQGAPRNPSAAVAARRGDGALIRAHRIGRAIRLAIND